MSEAPLPSNVCHLRGTKPGPLVVVFGGTHGDETMGVEVIKQILEGIGLPGGVPTGTMSVSSVNGDLFFGIGNPAAVAVHQRSASGGRDLNRCFHESFFADANEMASPDQQRAAELKDLLASADFFFDLHSVSAEHALPFVGVTTYSSRHAEVCRHIPVKIILDANNILGHDLGIQNDTILQTPTTCSWVNRHGGVGLCYEMGSQKDTASVPRALRVLIHLLEKIGSINSAFAASIGVAPDSEPVELKTQKKYRLTYCERNNFNNFHYSNDRFMENWTPVKKGDEIGRYADGTRVCAPDDGLLAFPAGKHTLSHNPSLFYLAKEIT